jgi:two-component system response regulator
MTEQLKILILEDSPDDVNLVERELKRAGIDFTTTVVSKRLEFENALSQVRPDVILSDHSLPSFNSIEALKLYQSLQPQLNLIAPFILVTGSVSEEFAVQCIIEGADDYILKDRLKRLPTSIKNAVEKNRIEFERQKYFNEVIANEAMLRQAERLAHLGSWESDLVTGVDKWSDESFRLYGYEPGEVKPGFELFINHVHPEDVESVKKDLANALLNQSTFERKYRVLSKNNDVIYVNAKLVIERDSDQKPIKLNGFVLDISEETKYIQKIEEQNNKLKEIAWMQSHGVRAPLARIMGLINIINTSPPADIDVNELLNHVLDSVNELDSLVRAVVKKAEELRDK